MTTADLLRTDDRGEKLRRLHKGIHLEVRNLETTDTLSKIRGTAVPYGVQEDVGFYLESFDPGSLAKSIEETARALPLMLFHDDGKIPIGHAAEWHETDDGLDGVWNLDDEAEAQQAARAANKGHLTGMSIRFQPVRSKWTWVEDWSPENGQKDSVVREEAKLLETSLVPVPAYSNASVQWVRSAPLRREQTRSEAAAWLEWVEEMRAKG